MIRVDVSYHHMFVYRTFIVLHTCIDKKALLENGQEQEVETF